MGTEPQLIGSEPVVTPFAPVCLVYRLPPKPGIIIS